MGTFTLRRGLSNVFAAEVIKDDKDEITFGTPFHLIPAGEMSRSVETESTPVYFDNVVFYQSGSEGPTEVSITGASLRPADVGRLLGKIVGIGNGVMYDTGEYTEKYFALGGETENTDGTKEYFWFYKGTFSISEQSDKTKDDSTDTNGTELVYSAIQTQHQFRLTDGEVVYGNKPMKRIVVDTETVRLATDASWTAQVVTPDNLGEVIEVIGA